MPAALVGVTGAVKIKLSLKPAGFSDEVNVTDEANKFTVSVATLLVAEPPEAVTTTK